MTHPLIEAIEQLPEGSTAPAVISAIYQMPDLTTRSRRALAVTFLTLYEQLT